MVSTVSQAGSINAQDYNNLHNKVNDILGQGSGDYGYGQTVTSSPVTATNYPTVDGDLVTAAQLDALRTDIEKCWKHQTSAAFTLGDIAVGDEITAGATTGADNKTHNQYVKYVNDIDANRLSIDAANQSTTSLGNSAQYTATWGVGAAGTAAAQIRYTANVSWSTATARRHYFNAGGQITIDASMNTSEGTGTKNGNWKDLLNRAGFNYDKTAENTQTTNAILRQTTYGTAGVYSDNYARIYTKNLSSTQLQCVIEFIDGDIGDDTTPSDGFTYRVDESVTGDITASLTDRTASGSFVAVTKPTYAFVGFSTFTGTYT